MATADKPPTDSDGGTATTSDDPPPGGMGLPVSTAATRFQTSAPADLGPGNRPGNPAADVESWFGRTIDGRYKIIELLGEGGMGAVFVAEHLALHKNVALKIIRPEFAGVPEIAARFAREAMATAKLDHPHVASALDYGKLPDGAAYLVIQLVRGQPLRCLLEKHSLPWPSACNIVSQIADALAGAHAEGIVHRDLKPDNVLLELRDDGRYLVKVVDFGIARVAADPGSTAAAPGDGLTRMGMVMGTPGYMSPEQALGEPVDHRTDLYALGVVLWECIAGRPLFMAESLTEVIAKQLAEAPSPLAALTGQAVPALLDDLILQLLARTPSARPESAAQIRETLRKLAAAGTAGEGEMIALPSSGFSQVRQTERAPTIAELPKAPGLLSRVQASLHRRWAEDRQRLLVLGGIAGTLLLVGIIGLLGLGREPSTSTLVPAHAAGKAVADAASAAADAGAETQNGDNKKKAKDKKKRKKKKKKKGKKNDDADGAEHTDLQGRGLLATASGIAALIDTLLRDDSSKARKGAAEVLLELPERQLPEIVRAIAELEVAKRCRNKREKLVALVEFGDPQILPAIERISDLPRRGCGMFRQEDCWSCLRRTVKDSLATLRAADD